MKTNTTQAAVVFVMVLTLVLASAVTCFAAAPRTITIVDLLADPKAYDGLEITIEGEAIGEPMVRGNVVWVSLYDSNTAVSALLPVDAAREISRYGDWKQTGDLVRISGVFKVMNPAQGGETHLDGHRVERVKSGSSRPHPIAPERLASAVILSLLSGAAGWMALRKHVRANDAVSHRI